MSRRKRIKELAELSEPPQSDYNNYAYDPMTDTWGGLPDYENKVSGYGHGSYVHPHSHIITPPSAKSIYSHSYVGGNTSAASVPYGGFGGGGENDKSLVEEMWESLQPLIDAEVERRCGEIVGSLQYQVNELWDYLREDEDE